MRSPWPAGCESRSAQEGAAGVREEPIDGKALTVGERGKYVLDEPLTRYKDITSYNNYYEFGTDKDDPAQNAEQLPRASPWTGRESTATREVSRPTSTSTTCSSTHHARGARLSHALRRRLVDGDPVGRLSAWRCCSSASSRRRTPSTSPSTTRRSPSEMPGQRGSPVLRLALRRGPAHRRGDAPADHPRGRPLRRELPNQNGAPIRLVVPWKYGFKGIKSIVQDRVRREAAADDLEHAPTPNEYGFYSNVNPRSTIRAGARHRAPHRRGIICSASAADAAVQRLRRSGREPLRGMDLQANF